MSKYPCKMCSETMMTMGYCHTHWQEVKATWTPNKVEHLTEIPTKEAYLATLVTESAPTV